jgi:phage terminase large subunit-like protein
MQDNNYLKDLLKSLPREQIAEAISHLSHEAAEVLLYDWQLWGRPQQLEPLGNWRTWIILAGRGFGKTRAGGEWVRSCVQSGKYGRVALIGATAADVRDVIVEGESGILAISPPNFRPVYEPSKRRLTWPNGAVASTFSAEEPDRLRGPQYDLAWCDELAAWQYAEAYDQLQFGLRLGQNPRQVITTTPRPTKLIKEIIKDPTTHVTRGSTYDNRDNLAPAFLAQIIKKYEGTRLGRQELNAEVLEDNPNALWSYEQIDSLRMNFPPVTLERIVVAIDPAVTSHEGSDETGITVTGRDNMGNGFVLADLTLSASPDEWAKVAVRAYHTFGADRIIGEVNNGGDLIEAVIRTVDRNVSYKSVRASRGKVMRAEPIAALYEQRRIHHVGFFSKLEDQMCNFNPAEEITESPDRLDSLVWGFTELFIGDTNPLVFGKF